MRRTIGGFRSGFGSIMWALHAVTHKAPTRWILISELKLMHMTWARNWPKTRPKTPVVLRMAAFLFPFETIRRLCELAGNEGRKQLLILNVSQSAFRQFLLLLFSLLPTKPHLFEDWFNQTNLPLLFHPLCLNILLC